MALALLRFAGVDGEGQLQFDAMLGSNRWYAWAIGDDEVDRSMGIPLLANRVAESALQEIASEHPAGREQIRIPAERFDRRHQYVQLTSFRTRDRTGPAISDIVRIPPGVARGGGLAPAETSGGELLPPPAGFALGMDMPTLTQPTAVAFTLRERDPLARAMFVDKLVPAIKALLPQVKDLMPIVGELLGQLAGSGLKSGLTAAARPAPGGAAGGRALPAPPQGDGDPETQRLLRELVKQVEALNAQLRAAPPAPAPAAASRPALAGASSLVRAAGRMPGRLAYAQEPITLAAIGGLAATVAPLLLQALPALAPLMEKVVGVTTDTIREVGNFAVAEKKATHEHLEKVNPIGVHAPLDALIGAMAQALGQAGGAAAPYRTVESVSIRFADLLPQVLHGRARPCFALGPLVFPLEVSTPRPIRNATLSVQLRHAETQQLVAEASADVAEHTGGRLQVAPAIPAERLRTLPVNRDWIVDVHLTWSNGKGQRLGARQRTVITLVGEFVFDRVEESATLIPLSDVERHRDFWHKVWQGTFSESMRRVELQAKYYYALAPERTTNARMETLLKEEGSRDRVTVARLKSGMQLGLTPLNRLIPLLDASAPALGEAELAALATPEFAPRLTLAGRFSATLHGRPGASAALWVYPELKLQEVVLLKPGTRSGTGQVQEFIEHRVRFPVPATIHTIGARTT